MVSTIASPSPLVPVAQSAVLVPVVTGALAVPSGAAASPSAPLSASLSEGGGGGGGPEAEAAAWGARIAAKAACLRSRREGNGTVDAGFVLFHTRKAAGTTVRAFLEQQCNGPYRPLSTPRGRGARRGGGGRGGGGASSQCLFESEGLALSAGARKLLGSPLTRGIGGGVVSVTAVRHPVARAWSLYWYEHVGWWDGVKHELESVKPLGAWLDNWQDGSPWKQAFGKANPGSTYVEPSDYFVKCFGGWVGPGGATEAHLAAARQTLSSFDVVLITERLGDPAHLSPLRALLGTDLLAGPARIKQELKADDEPKARLGPRLLGGNEASLRARLAAMNAKDLNLWAFANELAEAREEHLSTHPRVRAGTGAAACSGAQSPLAGPLAPLLGIHRPPKHKM